MEVNMITKESIKRQIEENGIKMIRLQFTDMMGKLKSVEVPVSQIDMILNNDVIFDGSSIEGFVRIMEADMYLYPDLATFKIIKDDIARLICDIYKTDRTPFEGDPRGNLKRVMKEMDELGYGSFNLGLEPEFYLLKLDEFGNPTADTNDFDSYFDLSAIEQAGDCLREIVYRLEEIGFTIEASHHEVGPGQYEINFKYANVLEACDNIQTYKHVVKDVASKYGLYASFMPKPFSEKAGSGMHTNCSLADKEGNNVFYDENAPLQLSQTCLYWIGGITKHARALCAITNPIVNSYKRLTPGYEAPCYIAWSTENRSTFIRIPASRKQATRTEIRSVDCSCNPYLAMAAVLACGLDGIKNKIEPMQPSYINIFELTRKERQELNIKNLPNSLKDALNSLEEDQLVINAIGKHTYEKFMEAKLKEWADYRHQITDWELKHYIYTI
ncbi:MAG: glutamine synthetase family protein [Bacilli bacterium]|jgi:glutamine synthetase|nr:glutamine synthetase family protein [Bacilli bacterium]